MPFIEGHRVFRREISIHDLQYSLTSLVCLFPSLVLVDESVSSPVLLNLPTKSVFVIVNDMHCSAMIDRVVTSVRPVRDDK
jgi:hypothetical protein